MDFIQCMSITPMDGNNPHLRTPQKMSSLVKFARSPMATFFRLNCTSSNGLPGAGDVKKESSSHHDWFVPRKPGRRPEGARDECGVYSARPG
uniref:Uncharacterized protein n=1 Tax=Steinernema glaseri TaxID=37863 RepID=A0A1I7ZND6_9BILA